jgi:hypothetical protein
MARVIPSVLVLLPLLTAPQGAKPAPSTALDYLYVSRDRVPWPSPESLEKDLRSKDEAVRLRALRLVGFSEQQAHVAIWTQTQPTKLVGEAVVAPDLVELQYAALGEDSTQQAILAVQASLRGCGHADPAGLGARRRVRVLVQVRDVPCGSR